MANERFDVNNVQVQMALVIKLHQLQRDILPTLTYQNLENYLTDWIWKKRLPRSLNYAVDDVMHISANDVVKYLTVSAISQGQKAKLEDFADLFGG